MTDADGQTFFLGITMAGAISAGAYTAGVLDVLLEALDRHNARFEAGRRADWQDGFADHPRHRVVLKVMSGTSAGGVSTGLALAGLIDARRPKEADDLTEIEIAGVSDYISPDGYSYPYQFILKPLHDVWVEALDLVRETGDTVQGLLSSDDLATGHVRSALNSSHIDEAAAVSLSDIRWNGKTYRFLAEDLEIFLTTTSLQGMPFRVMFGGAGDDDAGLAHAMAQHSIVRHFRLKGMGEVAWSSPWLEAWQDRGITLRAPVGRVDFEDPASTWSHFKTAAIATGAFPVGLAARVINAEARDFGPIDGGETRGGALPIDLKPRGTDASGSAIDARPVPQVGDLAPTDSVNYVAVDGGVANNEPFELARFTLCREIEGRAAGEKFLIPNPRGATDADRAILMIDPFPEGPVHTALTEELADELSTLMPAARTLLPALINQARFKPGELIEASNRAVRSRYLLAPSRRERSDEAEARGDAPPPARNGYAGAEAIACGSFGGFGGFFDRAFRAHDYMLGQRNCHSFLTRHFRLSARNPVLGLEGTALAGDHEVAVLDAGADFTGRHYDLPPWPRIRQQRLEPVLTHARARLGYVGSALINLSELPGSLRVALKTIWAANHFGFEGLGIRVSKALRNIVISELIKRDQHHDFHEVSPGQPYEPWQRAVLAAVAKAGDKPIPVAIDARPRAEMRSGGLTPRDLLAAIEMPEDTDADRSGREKTLERFLAAPEVARHLTRSPGEPQKGPSYVMKIVQPDSRWTELKRSVRGWFGV